MFPTIANENCRRTGFTIVELMVMLGIVTILTSLLLPAIHSAREAARQMQCSNNLKQIAFAVHNFENAELRLPGNERFSYPDPYRYSNTFWLIKEFIEVGDVKMDTRLPVFICPTDATYDKSTQRRIASYTTNKDIFDPGVSPDPPSGRLSNFNISTAFAQKGASNTIMLAERVVQCNFPNSGPWSAWAGTYFESYWNLNYLPLEPLAPLISNGGVRNRNDCSLNWFSSSHYGSIHVGLGDGSVRPVSLNIEPQVWQRAYDLKTLEPLGEW